MYMYATTKQEGLQRAYLKMRSIYRLMLKAGTSDAWNIVITSFIFDPLINFSFFRMDLSKTEETTDKTRGVLVADSSNIPTAMNTMASSATVPMFN